MKIWAHTLVKNEERHLWFAVESMIDYVDKILLWDTGSTDKTPEIIKALAKKHKDKISVRFFDEVTPEQFTVVRQKMLNETKADWFLILDGDEVWWKETAIKLIETIWKRGTNLDSIVSHSYNLVGDIFHYQEEEAGMYEIDGKKGHLNIRAVNRNIPGLHFEKPHGQQGIFDGDGVLIQDRKRRRIHIDEKAYLHFTNMIRSTNKVSDEKVPKRKLKLKYDKGIGFPKDFFYPEVFFREKPEIIPSPWIKRNKYFEVRSFFETPLKQFKRRYLPKKTGY